jgi:hypothetical protein
MGHVSVVILMLFAPSVRYRRLSIHSYCITMGSQKVPGIVVLHCNGRSYGSDYVITFKIGPMRAQTLTASILPLFYAPAEGFVWNLPEFGLRIRFEPSMVAKRVPLILCQSREK